ncbi:MAG TPA: tetratricopeptide repeat protein [Terriglobia bacterium]
MIRIGRWTGLGVLLGVWLGASAALAQTGGLTGHATLQDGSACVKCPIIIDRQSVKGHYETKTDKKGNYVYVGLPLDNYKVTLQDPNGKTLFFIGHHVGIGDPTEVNFDLPKEVSQQQQANPEQVKQQEQNQKEQKEFTGLKQIFDQGVALEGQKQYAEAAAMFQKAEPLAKDKNLAAVLEHEADAYRNAKMYDQAIAAYQKLIAMNPNDATFHNGLGTTYASMDKIPEAQAEFQKAAELNPAGAAQAYYNLGAILSNAGKMDEAADAFKKATVADPKYADAYFLEGQALMGKATMGADGKVVPAPGTLEALQTYLQLDPNGKYAATAQGMIQSITGEVPTEFKAKKKKS